MLKLVGGKAYRFADLFVVGASSAVLPSSATSLDFAWATTPVLDAFVDEEAGQVLFHGTLPANIAGDIKEIGLISQNAEFISSGLPVNIVYGFEPSEIWFSDSEYDVTNSSSVGPNSYKFTDAIVDQYLAKLVSDLNINRYDTVKMKLNSTGVTGIQLQFKNDEANYAWKNFTLVDGTNTLTSTVASFTKVGTFNPTKISEVRLIVKAAAATNSIEFDALTLSSNENGGLVARTALVVTQYKRLGATMEVEFAVALNG